MIQDINRRFQSYTGDSTARVKELWDSSGFLLNANDLISEVIDDGQIIKALDYDTWMKENLPLCKTTWLRVSQKDFVDGQTRTAELGIHKLNKLYIKLGHSFKEFDRLELFDADDIESFGQRRQTALGSFRS